MTDEVDLLKEEVGMLEVMLVSYCNDINKLRTALIELVNAIGHDHITHNAREVLNKIHCSKSTGV